MRRIGYLRLFFELALVASAIMLALRSSSQTLLWRDGIVHRVPVAGKVVALTFDDGPSPIYTPEILAILDRYHVKATFFMIGKQMDKYPDIVKDVDLRGHAIGNHTYTHPRNIEKLTRTQVIEEVERCERVIERFTRKHTHLFRPPRGLIDGPVSTIAEEEGYLTVLWTVSADHHEATTPEAMANRVLSRVVPGSVILAHDGDLGIRAKDVAATPLIIEGLLKRGYRLVTVPELLREASLH